MKNTLLITAIAVAFACACGNNPRVATPISQNKDFYAHRGGRAENDENTLQAFKQSISIGCDRFETDIRMAGDGMLVISHDANLKRRTGFDGNIEEMKGRDIISKKTFIGNNIPSLDQVLKLFRKEKVSYVEWELKTSNTDEYPDERIPVYCDAVYKAISEAQPEGVLWVFTSFDLRPLKYIKEHYPDAKTGLITADPVCDSTMNVALQLGAFQIDAGRKGTTREAVDAAHAAGLEVCLWPGTLPRHYNEMKELGADRCCTDIPNLLSLELK